MKKASIYFLTLFVVTMSLFSCDPAEEEINTNNQNVDSEHLAASAQIDFVNDMDFSTGVQAENDNVDGKTTTAAFGPFDCAVITVETPTTETFPKIFHIDFGTGCLYNGILRKGKLKITVSNYITETGSTMKIERENYYVNGIKVEGTVNYVNETTTPTIPQWSRTITDGKLTNLQGTVFLHSGTHTVKQTGGAATLTLQDNVYEVTQGNHSITKENGTTLILTVLTPLVKNFSCAYVSKGKLKIEGIINGVIDYGNGECDNLATYTHQNGVVYNLTL